MAWRVEYSSDAAKAMLRMPRNISALIRRKIEALATNPFAPNNNAKRLVGRPGYRLRVGDWRSIYELDTKQQRIIVLAAAARGSVYR